MSNGAPKQKDLRRDSILHGNLYKVLIRLSLPIMLSNLIQTFYNLADSYFVSKMGDNALNAIGVVWPIIFAIIGLGGGLSLGAVALISNHIGAGKKEDARMAAAQVISYLFILGIAMGLLGYFLSPLILRLMNVTDEIYMYATQYLDIMFVSVPFMYLFFAFQSTEQAQGNMMLPMIFSGISVGLNVVLDPIFIFTLDLGVQGAAYATVISRVLLGAGGIIYFFASKKSKYKPKFRQLIPNMKVIGQISKTGVPASLGQVTSSIGFMAINGLVLSYGEDVLTAFIIGNRIVSLIMMPCMGVGSALSTIIGQNIGAGLISRSKSALAKAFELSLIFAAVGIVILLILSEGFITLFTQSPNVIAHAKEYALIITLAMPLMTIFNIWTGLFIGAGKGTFSMIVMMSRLWVYRIPSILVLKYIFHMNEYAIWYPMIISNMLACLTGYVLYKRGNIFRSVYIAEDNNKTIIEERKHEACNCQQ